MQDLGLELRADHLVKLLELYRKYGEQLDDIVDRRKNLERKLKDILNDLHNEGYPESEVLDAVRKKIKENV